MIREAFTPYLVTVRRLPDIHMSRIRDLDLEQHDIRIEFPEGRDSWPLDRNSAVPEPCHERDPGQELPFKVQKINVMVEIQNASSRFFLQYFVGNKARYHFNY